MNKKIVIGLVVFGFVVSGIVFGMGSQPPQKENGQEVKEWKTYVSKYGFSVSYPADWYLWEEWSASGNDWVSPFGIVDTDPNISADLVPEDKRMGLGFNAWDVPRDMPEGAKERLIYIAKNQQMALIESLEIIEKDGDVFCLIYGVPKGGRNKAYKLIFYLPHSRRRVSDDPSIKMIGFADIDTAEKHSVNKLLDKIRIKVNK